jgi:hypothetical protein
MARAGLEPRLRRESRRDFRPVTLSYPVALSYQPDRAAEQALRER